MNDEIIKRNATSEFLMFTASAKQSGVEVLIKDENVWLTQDLIGVLYGVDRTVVSKHLKNIFACNELDEKEVCAKFAHTSSDGKTYHPKYYNLEAIISVGYKVNSSKAVEFRKWATRVLKKFTIQGYVLDKKRLENGAYLSEDYYEKLLEEIREIRLSERKFYQKITDIYATALDYDKTSEITQNFYKTVQNKLHYAIHGHTAPELIMQRANAEKTHMGLTTWENAPDGKILKSDVVVVKNYLTEEELRNLARFVNMYLDYAENQASKHIPMTMEDWTNKLNAFLKFNEYDILNNAGKVSAEIAKAFAESEFEKYRIVQDKLYQSDFDQLLLETKKNIKK